MDRKRLSFSAYLEKKLADPSYRRRFERTQDSFRLGIELARMRHDAGLTQEELADRVGMKKQNIARLERPDYGSYTIQTLQRVASALGKVVTVSFENATTAGDHESGSKVRRV